MARILPNLILLLALVACQAAGAPGADSSDPARPKVDRVVMLVEPPAREGNEGRHQSAPDNWQLKPMYEYLAGMDSQAGKIVPELATEWSIEPTGLAIRFKLRKGVQFHQGKGEFTAKDLVPTWQEIIKDDSLAGASPFWRLVIRDVEAVNDHEAVYHLKRPDSNFLTSISRFRGGMEMFSKAHFEANGPALDIEAGPIAGTGPYQFKERKQAQYIRYERTPYEHWRAKPEFPEFEFRFAREASTRFAALATGEVQMADLPLDLRKQAKDRGFTGILARDSSLRTSMHVYGVYLNDRTERTPTPDASKGLMYPDSPLNDVRVRRALSKAIDREALNKAFFGGEGKPMHLSHFSPTRPGWDPGWERRFQEQYGYDREAARRLLAEAGYGPAKPVTTNIIAAKAYGFSGAEDVAEAVAAMWRAAGINVNLLNIEESALTNARRQFRYDNHLWINGTGSDQWTGVTTYGSTQGTRGNGVELPEANELLGQLGSTLDERKQEELWRKVGEILYLQHKEIPLFSLPIAAMVDPKIIADWVYPGAATGSWTHVENIKAAR